MTMSKHKLRNDIEKLRDEIKHLHAGEASSKEKLESLLQDIESDLKAETQDGKKSELLAELRDSVEYFETEHPRATAIINDIMITLSNMGI